MSFSTLDAKARELVVKIMDVPESKAPIYSEEITLVADALREVVKAEREACCKLICLWCERGYTVEFDSGMKEWYHPKWEGHSTVPCHAAAIRARKEGT